MKTYIYKDVYKNQVIFVCNASSIIEADVIYFRHFNIDVTKQNHISITSPDWGK